ncbi:SDR family oxidoreductase [Kribbella sp. NPDC051770]|uniref:SDR family NAD(P)-dependent oxidoreductase n=1 Tax=Kribbella sp. NPDC051770 TaxID=3155413 RepID=UPI00343CB8B6
MSLSGKHALVTGAGRGIGQAVAWQLAAAGVRTTLVARTETQLAETVARIHGSGGAARALTADLAEPADVPALLDKIVAEGPIDLLINNAATVAPLSPSARVDPEAWAHAFALNVVSPATLTFAVLPGMLSAGWGRIVNVSSGVVANPASLIGGNAYVATKAALEAHTLNLAAELSGTGVTVNVYRPGTVDTAMQAGIRSEGGGRLDAATHERFLTTHAEGRLITPEESARALVDQLGGDASGQIWNAPSRARS